jgi:DegV family protein with EDD domain
MTEPYWTLGIGEGLADPMNKVKLITDSNTCLPPALIGQYGIAIVPLRLIFGEKVLRDGVDITPDEFYARLQKESEFPTTSSPGPEPLLEVYRQAEDEGAGGAVVITISKNLSMMYSSARLAAKSVGDFPVAVVDSRMATMAEGFVVLAAAEAAHSGADLKQVVSVAKTAIPRTGFAFVLDTLTYLKRGGRVPGIAAMVGNALHIHPVIGSKGPGQIGILAPAHGVHQAEERLITTVEKRIGGRGLKGLAVMHACAAEKAEELMSKIDGRFEAPQRFITEFSPVMGAHAGPGTFGLAYFLDGHPGAAG